MERHFRKQRSVRKGLHAARLAHDVSKGNNGFSAKNFRLVTKGVTTLCDILSTPIAERFGPYSIERSDYFQHRKNMIKRIELINFMSHEHTVIEPSSGLTVLIGPNNCGKSAIVTALQIICNNPKSTYVLRHGAKECKIILETDSGDVIQWSRKKSGSPKYVINGELFDRLKGKIPEELHAILRMPQVQVDKESFDVHFGEQTSPLFLLADKEKAAAQFFASSSDAIRLVEMQDRHKSNIKIRKADLKRVTQQRDTLLATNEILSPVPALHKQALQCEESANAIADEKKQILRLEQSVGELLTTQSRSERLLQLSEVLQVIPDLPQMQPTAVINSTLEAIASAQRQIRIADAELKELLDLQLPPKLTATDRLESWVESWQQNQRTLTTSEAHLTALSNLQTPPETTPTIGLRDAIELLETQQRSVVELEQRLEVISDMPEVPQLQSAQPLKNVIQQFDELLANLDQQSKLVDLVNTSVEKLETEIEDWLGENPQCPTCGGEISKEQILEKSGGHVHA